MKTNISLRYGLLTGLISAVTVQILFLTIDFLNSRSVWGFHLSTIRGVIGLFSMVILGTGIYIGMHKSKTIEGGISWGRAAMVGIIISLVAAVIATIGAVVFNYMNPEFSDRMINESTALLVKEGKSAEQIQLAGEKMKQESSFLMLAVQAFTGQFFGGTIISLIMALFFRNTLKK